MRCDDVLQGGQTCEGATCRRSTGGCMCTSRKSTETGKGVLPWVCTRLGPLDAAAERSWAWLPSETRCVVLQRDHSSL
eukprot:1054324-Prorocentrum_minimum.AAC.1